MHDSFVDLKMEHHYGLHHVEDFGSAQMIGVVGDHSPNQSPSTEYGDFSYSASTQVQLDALYSRPMQPSFSSPQPLQPLVTMPQWPSQITNPSPSENSPPISIPLHRPILPLSKTDPIPILAPASAPAPTPAPMPSSTKSTHTSSSQRKTLTDNERRRMCEYHNENPSVKQTEIGSMFGVERSTVSKVLRNKEKYLVPEDGSRSPIRRSKSKFPDIERTLSQWAKNRRSQHLPLDDDLIKDQARIFATSVGGSDCHHQVNDPAWLEQFKQKNDLPGVNLGVQDQQRNHSRSGSHPPNGVSPVGWDGLPISSPKDDPNSQSSDNFMDSSGYGHTHTQSATSLRSCFSDPSSFASEFRSPTSSIFSPISSCGPSPSLPAQKMARLPPLAPATSLRRRQTVPFVSSEVSPDSATSKHMPPSSTLDSPMEDMEVSPLSNLDPASRHSRSSTTPITNPSPLSMAPPTSISPTIGTESPSSPPSKDEARAALSTLMTFIKHQPENTVDPQDYIVMGKWLQMLKLEIRKTSEVTKPLSMSGNERADGTLPMGKKRSEHSLS